MGGKYKMDLTDMQCVD